MNVIESISIVDLLNSALLIWLAVRTVGRVDEHDERIHNHETRITVLEKS